MRLIIPLPIIQSLKIKLLLICYSKALQCSNTQLNHPIYPPLPTSLGIPTYIRLYIICHECCISYWYFYSFFCSIIYSVELILLFTYHFLCLFVLLGLLHVMTKIHVLLTTNIKIIDSNIWALILINRKCTVFCFIYF